MKSFKNLNYPYYHALKFSQKLVISAELNWRTAPAIQAEIFAQKDSSDNVTWIFELALLSRPEIFAKMRQFRWCHSKVWPAPIITSWNFSQNTAVLFILLEILNWTADMIWKFALFLLSRANAFAKSKAALAEVTWKFERSLFSRGKHFSKIWQILWS